MAYQRKRNKGESPKLDMTPMIDVVFQLLIFFVVTLKQEESSPSSPPRGPLRTRKPSPISSRR
jgi:biopolymer transport protein ExbD